MPCHVNIDSPVHQRKEKKKNVIKKAYSKPVHNAKVYYSGVLQL